MSCCVKMTAAMMVILVAVIISSAAITTDTDSTDSTVNNRHRINRRFIPNIAGGGGNTVVTIETTKTSSPVLKPVLLQSNAVITDKPTVLLPPVTVDSDLTAALVAENTIGNAVPTISAILDLSQQLKLFYQRTDFTGNLRKSIEWQRRVVALLARVASFAGRFLPATGGSSVEQSATLGNLGALFPKKLLSVRKSVEIVTQRPLVTVAPPSSSVNASASFETVLNRSRRSLGAHLFARAQENFRKLSPSFQGFSQNFNSNWQTIMPVRYYNNANNHANNGNVVRYVSHNNNANNHNNNAINHNNNANNRNNYANNRNNNANSHNNNANSHNNNANNHNNNGNVVRYVSHNNNQFSNNNKQHLSYGIPDINNNNIFDSGNNKNNQNGNIDANKIDNNKNSNDDKKVTNKNSFNHYYGKKVNNNNDNVSNKKKNTTMEEIEEEDFNFLPFYDRNVIFKKNSDRIPVQVLVQNETSIHYSKYQNNDKTIDNSKKVIDNKRIFIFNSNKLDSNSKKISGNNGKLLGNDEKTVESSNKKLESNNKKLIVDINNFKQLPHYEKRKPFIEDLRAGDIDIRFSDINSSAIYNKNKNRVIGKRVIYKRIK